MNTIIVNGCSLLLLRIMSDVCMSVKLVFVRLYISKTTVMYHEIFYTCYLWSCYAANLHTYYY